MMNLTNSMLLSGCDIPFQSAAINIHCPRLQQIEMIGEDVFFQGCEFLSFSKEVLSDEDKINLKDVSDFEVFMSIINDKSQNAIRNSIISMMLVFTLMFPEHKIKLGQDKITLSNEDGEHYIDKDNFKEFQTILSRMFCLQSKDDSTNYKPASSIAKQIAEKLKKGRAQAAAGKSSEKTEIFILGRYASILAVGLHLDITQILANWTVYQLYDQFERFQLNESNKMNIQARLAGAKDLEEPDNWMKDIHES